MTAVGAACDAGRVPDQWSVPDWEEAPETWTMLDDAQLAARSRSRYPWHQRARHATVRFLAAPLTVVRLRRAGWKRREWRSWEPPGR